MSAENDLKELRRAHASLDKPIHRLAIVRLTVLIVLVFSFGRAFDRLDREIKEIPEAHEAPQKPEHAPSKGDSEDDAEEAVSDRASPSNEPDARKEAAYEKAFTVKLPIPELDVEIDLRYWIYGLPFALIVSQLVLVQLARRQRLLARLAAAQLAKLGDAAATAVDRFAFDPDARLRSFLAFPSRMLAALEAGAVMILLAYMVVVGRPIWHVWTTGALVSAAMVLVTAIHYAVALDILARVRQERAVAVLLETPFPPPTLARTWDAMRMRVASLATRLRPRWTLGVGAHVLDAVSSDLGGLMRARPARHRPCSRIP